MKQQKDLKRKQTKKAMDLQEERILNNITDNTVKRLVKMVYKRASKRDNLIKKQ